jgi:hypothetical protein
MDPAAVQIQNLAELQARHDQLLRDLEALDKRVARVLAEYTGGREGAEPAAAGTVPPEDGDLAKAA